MELIDNLFIAPNGKLYKETKLFRKCCNEIIGVSIMELYPDAYERNLRLGVDCLFPVDFNCPFQIVEHANYERDYEGFKNGGGFRLDLNY